MARRMLASLLPLLLACSTGAPRQEVALDRDDTVLRASVSVRPGTYRRRDANGNGVVRIEGDGLTIDFQGAVLDGAEEGATPDAFSGFGLVAENCKRLTLRNLVVRGFKIGMHFKNCPDLTVEGCDVSRNFRQRLKSTPRAEAGEDWLYAHENDKNEWFRYGAGIYVESSDRVTLSRNRARNGQNGLCLSKVNDSAVIDNDMSFMSGWGLAMWRSCRNDVSNNKFDWCMRGFSYDVAAGKIVYHRGQDSAGILVYEQCHDNVFAYNSATHGGDGFFLYAGNETLQKTGAGGCNRNILYRNDFSHAAANGIEATFSDGNAFVENRLEECDHGIWAGYSYNTLVLNNTIRNCANGVSIEHGHANRIEGNAFENNRLGIHAWWNPNEQFKKTPYGQKVDTASRGYAIHRNTFKGEKVAIQLKHTTDVSIAENTIDAAVGLRVQEGCDEIRASGGLGKIEGPEPRRVAIKVDPAKFAPPKTRGTQDALLPKNALRGWRTIHIDEWGPYDFTHPRAFPNGATAWGSAEHYLLGPEGEFAVVGVEGEVEIAPRTGRVPGSLKVAPRKGAGLRPYSFTVAVAGETLKVTGALLLASWDVTFFAWERQGPQKPPKDWKAVLEAAPLETRSLDRIDFTWGGGRPGDKVPPDHFATLATTTLELPAGRYEVRTVSDDGVRVTIDGAVVIDNWTWHPPTENKATVTLEAGRHAIVVEHFEIDGYAQLQFWISPVK